jgi:lipopolysaccharide export system protein LptA
MAERLLKHGKKNDSTYNGQVYFMKGTDTIHTEKILLQQVEDELSYNTTIKVKMTMNQYPLYLRIEMKRNLF